MVSEIVGRSKLGHLSHVKGYRVMIWVRCGRDRTFSHGTGVKSIIGKEMKNGRTLVSASTGTVDVEKSRVWPTFVQFMVVVVGKLSELPDSSPGNQKYHENGISEQEARQRSYR